MKRLQAIGLFAEPSPFSVAMVIVTTFGMLLIANLTFLHDSGLLQNTVFGSDSQLGLVQTSSITWSVIADNIFDNSIVNKVLFFGFWMLIGLVVFVILNGLTQSVAETTDELHSLRYVHAQKHFVERQLIARMLVRLVAGLGICLNIWALLGFVLPFSVLSSRVWLNNANEPINWLYGFLGLTVLLLTLHVLAILLRLLVLRPRVFGGWDRFAG